MSELTLVSQPIRSAEQKERYDCMVSDSKFSTVSKIDSTELPNKINKITQKWNNEIQTPKSKHHEQVF